MKELLIILYKKYKKIIILVVVGLLLITIGNVLWDVHFSRIKQFKENEKTFYESVKRYYDYHKQLLPKKGETRVLTLQDLYSKGLIEDLYVPKTKETCDVNASRVRVYQNNDGEYMYNTYLKCGKYESKIDHDGPTIFLNGDDTIILAINSEYKELGIKEVKDNTDGNIDASKVIIDTNGLNMKEIGTYKITYTVFDSSFNKTVKERKVYIRKNLTEEAKKNTDDSNYYKGRVDNNYLLFSGILFRIVNVNSDGTIKIASDQSIAATTYSKIDAKYSDSNIKEWLDNMFYKNLYNTDDYVENVEWCIDSSCKEKVKDKVGLLTLDDINKSLDTGKNSYLSTPAKYFLITKDNDKNVYISIPTGEKSEKVETNKIYGIKPVLVLKANLFVASGDGTIDNPYRVNDYKDAKKNDLLNTRLIGEYVDYSGMNFRIAGFDKDKNIKLIADEAYKTTSSRQSFTIGYANEEGKMLFDPKQEGNLGYYLNNDFVDYLDESLIVKQTCSIPKFEENKNYSEYKIQKEYKTKVCLPASYDLFSIGYKGDLYDSWLIDYVNDKEAYIINGLGDPEKVEGAASGFKIVILVNKNSKIINGTGKDYNPFRIK